MPSTSPSPTVKETPSMARMVPLRVKNWVRRSSTSSTGTAARGASGMTAPAIASHAPRKARVQEVAQPITEQVDRQHGHAQEKPGIEQHPKAQLDDDAAPGHDISPARDL